MEQMKEHCPSPTREHVIEVMFRLLESYSFNTITVFKICKHANISRTTFYLHFQDKYDLVCACMECLIKPMEEILSIGKLEQGLNVHLEYIEKYKKSVKNLILSEVNKELQQYLQVLLTRPIIKYYQYLESQGVLFLEPIEVLAAYHYAGICAISSWWLTSHNPVSKEIILSYILNNFNTYK